VLVQEWEELLDRQAKDIQEEKRFFEGIAARRARRSEKAERLWKVWNKAWDNASEEERQTIEESSAMTP
jgi:hypothetical protein